MTFAEKLCLSGAFLFFFVGLVTGVWKYGHTLRSAEGRAPYYVDTAHRSALLYAFAALLLSRLAALSSFSDPVNSGAALASLTFFALAIATYVVHGLLQDTDNQLQRPHKLGKGVLGNGLVMLFMISLIVAEIGGAAILGIGAGLRIWTP